MSNRKPARTNYGDLGYTDTLKNENAMSLQSFLFHFLS